VRTRLVVLVAATALAVLALLPVTSPRLRPWRSRTAGRTSSARAHAVTLASGGPGAHRPRPARPTAARRSRSAVDRDPPAAARTQGPAFDGPPAPAVAPPGPVFYAAPPSAAPVAAEVPWFSPAPTSADPGPAEVPWLPVGGYPAEASAALGQPWPRAELPEAEPAYPADPGDPFLAPGWRPGRDYLPMGGSFSGPDPLADPEPFPAVGPLADGGAPEAADPLSGAWYRDRWAR
jgi:hypothetical protein